MAIKTISTHAMQRLKQRKGVTHPVRVTNHILKWGGVVPIKTGFVYRNRWIYYVKDETLITVYRSDEKRIKRYKTPVLVVDEYGETIRVDGSAALSGSCPEDVRINLL